MKLRIGRYAVADEIAAMERLVATAPAMIWMADGNGAYGYDDSLRLGHALHALGFRWLEEPLPTNDYAAYATLARELAIPLAGGETLETADAAEPFLRAGSFDLVQPDVSICGGIRGVLDIARFAADVGRFAVPHACSGAIALAATLQVLAVLLVPADAPPWAEPILEYDVGEKRPSVCSPGIPNTVRTEAAWRTSTIASPTRRAAIISPPCASGDGHAPALGVYEADLDCC